MYELLPLSICLWTGSYTVAQAGRPKTISNPLVYQPSQCWDYRYEPLHLAFLSSSLSLSPQQPGGGFKWVNGD